jgi:hypothetical protein
MPPTSVTRIRPKHDMMKGNKFQNFKLISRGKRKAKLPRRTERERLPRKSSKTTELRKQRG